MGLNIPPFLLLLTFGILNAALLLVATLTLSQILQKLFGWIISQSTAGFAAVAIILYLWVTVPVATGLLPLHGWVQANPTLVTLLWRASIGCMAIALIKLITLDIPRRIQNHLQKFNKQNTKPTQEQ